MHDTDQRCLSFTDVKKGSEQPPSARFPRDGSDGLLGTDHRAGWVATGAVRSVQQFERSN